MDESKPASDLEKFVARNKQGLSAVAENLNEAIVIAENGKLWFANSKFLLITGYSWEEIKGLRIHEIFFPPGSLESIAEEKRINILYESRFKGISQAYETHIIRKDGKRRWVETNAAPLRDEGGKIIGSVGTITDITERKNLEEQVRWSQKMEAVGRLAGGIAHDFNNLLTVIGGYARELRNADAISSDPELLQQADTIIGASESASALTKQLLTISRRQVVRMAPIRLNDVIQSALAVIEGLASDRVKVETSLDANLPLIIADSSQMQQILMNLAVNARDAMPNGGTLNISTTLVNESNQVELNPKTLDNTYVRLRVTDTGEGIRSEIQDKIFEPFFTTKKGKVKGSGLGLSIAFGIVKDHKGEILVTSEPGCGATFDVRIPAAYNVASTVIVPIDERRTTSGSEVILVAEDERGIRNLLKLSLQRLGYTILDVADGQDAIEVAENVKRIDLVITDIIMPRVGGLEVIKTLRDKRPDLKIIAMSGYADEKDVGEKLKDFGCEFLEKPFSADVLAKLVRTVLDKKSLTAPHQVNG